MRLINYRIENYKRRKSNSIIHSIYLIEEDLSNLELLINYKLKIPTKQEINDPLIKEILSVLI